MRALRLIVIACALAGCAEPAPAPSASSDAGPSRTPSLPPSALVVEPVAEAQLRAAPSRPSVRAGESVDVPAGVLRAGSLPGTPDRRPSVEADLVEVAMGPFSIDRLPYPNDPDRAPILVASRAEAARLCAGEGRRLCTELEWERACKGEGAAPYATGETLDVASCGADRTACPSPLGVLDLGVRAPEWTSSDADERLARLERTAVARGGELDGALDLHRCGARQAVAPESAGPLAFRCCEGSAPSPAYPDVGLRRVFRDLDLDEARLREILRGVPELSRYADAFRPHDAEDALRALARGGAAADAAAWELAPGPFVWSPSPGEEIWILTGSSAESTIIAALYALPGGRFLHAASFVLADEDAPIAVQRDRGSRAELLWTACLGCFGESGTIRFDEHARIVIAQQ